MDEGRGRGGMRDGGVRAVEGRVRVGRGTVEGRRRDHEGTVKGRGRAAE
jgi:hypothetical protein